tara:strand:+ start:468 stop:791 length:324 start_codon:yes stop_codon:yes gene_type:complete
MPNLIYTFLMVKQLQINHLRVISLIEGISYLLLVGVGMPLKYQFGMGLPNKILGLSHGVLSVVFFLVLFVVWQQRKLTLKLSLQVFFASLIPFGAIWAEFKLKALNV